MDKEKLKKMCEECFFLSAEAAAFDQQKKDKNNEISVLKAEIVKHFEAEEITRMDTEYGSITRIEKKSVKILDRNLFYRFLEAKGVFRDSVSLSVVKAASIYEEYYAEAQLNKDFDFVLNGVPGLSEPSIFVDVRINKPKKKKA